MVAASLCVLKLRIKCSDATAVLSVQCSGRDRDPCRSTLSDGCNGRETSTGRVEVRVPAIPGAVSAAMADVN